MSERILKVGLVQQTVADNNKATKLILSSS